MKYEITSKKEFQIEAAKALLADGQPHSYAEIVQHIDLAVCLQEGTQRLSRAGDSLLFLRGLGIHLPVFSGGR